MDNIRQIILEAQPDSALLNMAFLNNQPPAAQQPTNNLASVLSSAEALISKPFLARRQPEPHPHRPSLLNIQLPFFTRSHPPAAAAAAPPTVQSAFIAIPWLRTQPEPAPLRHRRNLPFISRRREPPRSGPKAIPPPAPPPPSRFASLISRLGPPPPPVKRPLTFREKIGAAIIDLTAKVAAPAGEVIEPPREPRVKSRPQHWRRRFGCF